MEFPYGHKARLSSGQGIKWTCRHTRKKKCTHNFFVCKQTLLPGCVCAHMHICINKFSFCYLLQDFGESEGCKNQRKGNYCLYSGGMFIPLAFHISTGQSPQTLLLPVMMGREEMETVKSAYPILPFAKFLGQQKCFNGPNPLHLPKA